MKKIILTLVMLTMASAAKAESYGLLCNGNMLVSARYAGIAASYQSGEECMNALRFAKNGFICYRNMLLSAYREGAVTTFNSTDECLDALANSK